MKKENSESVLQFWVTFLPFTQQALLMLALRGPDGLPKHTSAKKILHYLRGVVIKPAYPDFHLEDGFMCIDYGENQNNEIVGIKDPSVNELRPFGWKFNKVAKHFFADVDSLPHHFLMHLIHAAEVIGYNHPDADIASVWCQFYGEACLSFHMIPESKRELNQRLKF